ncbi:guanylate kinase|uniref:Guanylate kinase n=1 Tax=Dendrosporobacter quercicolus TaxID=146817 RepID=A0A1G9XT97_9FIRM|nr:GTPase [Dendrosporobacter quercicolus]NSL49089.1 guanylate kinase [Dendrosporobacter quercicolus DSM 1736]SDN00042.1 guanylate kinase [Dendrosporobacter quercicolus]
MNKVFVIIGPPASGKTSIANRLASYGIPEMVSHTTRQPREGEINGESYYFVSKEEFAKMDLIERVNYSGQYYGLSKQEVLKKVKEQPLSIVVVERTGLEQLKKLLGERLESIYIMIDDTTIIDRMLNRGQSNETIQRRLEYAQKNGEFNHWQLTDYVVKNTKTIDSAVRQVMAIMGLSVPAVEQ